jgi:CRISPR-associated protein Csx14
MASREILVAVTGLTPQVITETLYFFIQKRKPAINISEIYAITTKPGKELILELLLDEKKGAFYSFCREYGIDPASIKFNKTTISVLKGADGRPLSDIRTEEENIAVANAVTDIIRELTLLPDTRLHCSIAGGRKTMGVYLGYALQLFGRPQDALYHVLVSPEFEGHPDFFYKPKKNKVLTLNGPQGKAKKINTKNAKIELAEIPFVRLRDRLPSLFGKKTLSYTQMVSRAQREIDSIRTVPDLIIDTAVRQVRIGKKSVSLSPLEMVVLMYFARKKLEECSSPKRESCENCTGCFEPIEDCSSASAAKKMLDDYSSFYATLSGSYQKLEKQWSQYGAPHDRIRENISKIKKAISSITDSTLYHVSSIRQYGQTRYGIRLDRKKIKIL